MIKEKALYGNNNGKSSSNNRENRANNRRKMNDDLYSVSVCVCERGRKGHDCRGDK